MATPLKELQRSITAALQATSLASQPYVWEGLRLGRTEYEQLATPHNASVRLFYLRRYFSGTTDAGTAELQALVTRVPAVCVDGDRYIVTQSGETYHSLAACRAAHPSLLDTAQRRLSRNKCLASRVTVLAGGGYKSRAAPLESARRFPCVVVSGAGPQFEASYLDFADVFVTRSLNVQDGAAAGSARANRLPEYEDLSAAPPDLWDEVEKMARPEAELVAVAQRDPGAPLPPDAYPAYVRFKGAQDALLDVRAFVATVRETVHLWLSAFDSMVAAQGEGARGYFKLVSIGTGFFATLPDRHGSVNIGKALQPVLLRCALELLHAAPDKYPRLHALEFPDFSGQGLYSPTIDRIAHVRLVAAPRSDALDFPDEVRRGDGGWVPGVLNPGDCFALVGNEVGHGSVEAMIGSNSTLRFNQNYLWNEHILDRSKWEGVDL